MHQFSAQFNPDTGDFSLFFLLGKGRDTDDYDEDVVRRGIIAEWQTFDDIIIGNLVVHSYYFYFIS